MELWWGSIPADDTGRVSIHLRERSGSHRGRGQRLDRVLVSERGACDAPPRPKETNTLDLFFHGPPRCVVCPACMVSLAHGRVHCPLISSLHRKQTVRWRDVHSGPMNASTAKSAPFLWRVCVCVRNRNNKPSAIGCTEPTCCRNIIPYSAAARCMLYPYTGALC
jgi:hypothetical protein